MNTIHSQVLCIDQDNIDTDQIIPARYLNVIDFEGLGAHAFADWRYDDDGGLIAECPFNQPYSSQCQILLAGHNFGCGSSREHAPQALLDFGFRAVLSTRIADIFRNNALGCGLLALQIEAPEYNWIRRHPTEAVRIDVNRQILQLARGHQVGFELDPFVRHCLLEGTDALGVLLQHESSIAAHEAGHWSAHRENAS